MTDNEAAEKLRAWYEGCLTCRQWRAVDDDDGFVCHTGIYEGVDKEYHVGQFTLRLVDVSNAGFWAAEDNELMHYSHAAASILPRCPKYERRDA